MTTVPNDGELVRFDEVCRETRPVAVLRQEPEQLPNWLMFQEGYDDLDYLVFDLLPVGAYDLSPKRTFHERSVAGNRWVALIRHKGALNPGTEVCVAPDNPDVPEALYNTVFLLDVSPEDLTWIHPDYAQEVKSLLLPQKISSEIRAAIGEATSQQF